MYAEVGSTRYTIPSASPFSMQMTEGQEPLWQSAESAAHCGHELEVPSQVARLLADELADPSTCPAVPEFVGPTSVQADRSRQSPDIDWGATRPKMHETHALFGGLQYRALQVGPEAAYSARLAGSVLVWGASLVDAAHDQSFLCQEV